jgi:hypothetical protein
VVRTCCNIFAVAGGNLETYSSIFAAVILFISLLLKSDPFIKIIVKDGFEEVLL